MQTILTEPIYEQYLAAILAGERARCVAIVRELVVAEVGIKDLYVNLFQRALYQVGELWEHQRISVAVEHLATEKALELCGTLQLAAKN
jgi:methanogenic corrinoid protein MtbC1